VLYRKKENKTEKCLKPSSSYYCDLVRSVVHHSSFVWSADALLPEM
jgi:hypothetical protein